MKKKSAFFLLFALALTGVCTYACKTKQTASTPVPTYIADIKKIVDENCAMPCHNPEKKKHGMINLDTYEAVKASSTDKAFLGAIKHEEGFTPMPKNHDKLNDSDIEKISRWVQNGAPE